MMWVAKLNKHCAVTKIGSFYYFSSITPRVIKINQKGESKR